MKKYRILVIDDEFKAGDRSRKETISKYFTNDWIIQNSQISNRDEIIKRLPIEFELLFSATMDEFREQVEKRDIHAFFIDYVLYDPERPRETGDFKDNDFKEVLHLIKDKYSDVPIYIYSSKWNESLVYNVLEDFNDVFLNKRLPNQLLTFRNFVNSINDCCLNKTSPNWNNINKIGKARERIWEAISTAKNHVQFRPAAPSGDIVILHISDLQFGDKATTLNDIGIWNDMDSEIKKYLAKKDLQGVDLVLITGDLAMAGKKTEYEEAEEEMKIFFRRLWGDDDAAWKDRIIMVPGNHDFDINACVLEYFKAEIKEDRSIDFDSVIHQIEEQKDGKSQDTKNIYQRLGLQTFRKFAYELTHDEQYIRSENLDFIVNKFNNWGLRFICLNSIFRIDAQKTNRAGISTDSIREICKEVDSREELLTIILTHHTLLSKEYLNEEEASNIKNALNILGRSAGAKIVMGGHRHKNEEKANTNSAKKTIHTVEAASLRVETRSDEYVRGFGLLTISGTLKSAELQYFVFDKNDGEIKVDRAYSYDL